MFDLKVIDGTSLLREEDFQFLSSLAEELNDTLDKRQVFRTETEMRVSVLNDIKHPTAASKYWQAVREQAVMFENLVSAGFDYRRNEVKIKRLEDRLKSTTDAFDREELCIDLDECLYRRKSIEKVAHDRIREIRLWSQIKVELDDGSFDTSDVNTHQLVSYAQRFVLQASNAPENMPVAEANNLRGQLVTSLRALESNGLLDQVLSELPAPVVDRALVAPGLLKLEQKHDCVH